MGDVVGVRTPTGLQYKFLDFFVTEDTEKATSMFIAFGLIGSFGSSTYFLLPFAHFPFSFFSSIFLLALSLFAVIFPDYQSPPALLSGMLSDSYGRRPIVIAAGILQSIPLFGFIFYSSFSFVLLMAIVFGAGYGAYVSLDWALASDNLPSSSSHAKDLGKWK
jgi:MFS family permease